MMLPGRMRTLRAARMQGFGRLVPLQPVVHAYSVAATPAIMPHAACGIRPSRPVLRTLVIAAAASSGLEGQQPESYGGLAKYLAGLTAEEQKDVFNKLEAEGYAVPGREDKVDSLTDAMLEKFGIQPGAVRSLLLKAFALCGPSKSVTLVDKEGNEEKKKFKSKRVFESWVKDNTIALQLEAGDEEVILLWDQLQDGGTYITSKSLTETVTDLENYQKTQDKVLVHEVAEKALADMLVLHPEAKRLICDRHGFLRNKRLGTKRQIDEIIVADNCVEVLEVKQVVDPDAADQLGTAIEFIKQGVADSQPDFDFAKRSDGSLKEIKGALGGALLVPVETAAQKVEQRRRQEDWGLYVVGAGRVDLGTSCHPAPPLPAK